MPDILHKISINAPRERVYAALATVDGLAGWWTSTTSGESKPGETLEFRFGKHVCRMRVEAQQQGAHVAWLCTDDTGEWEGTRLTFDLLEDAGRTTLLFGHRAWREGSQFFAHCSMKWATFLLSLRELVESGTGRPFPRDVQI
ncbi:MAG TPA: SRPBCC domain-containing protein [Polyangiaceae bacterium]|nr:SRPBCC domain-containing protein [Polyangiaceae bacterium]